LLPKGGDFMSGIRFTWQCMECGRTFRTVAAAERAASDGCPNCGGVDVDIATVPGRVRAEHDELAYRAAVQTGDAP
jgi:predicted  nucleic acid-binding Zn-ribbon protein